MSLKSELKWGSILSYIQMALNVIIGLLYTPVMIRLLGNSEYGLYSTVSSTISILSILSLGFNSSYIRYFAKYSQRKDLKRVFDLNGLFLRIFCVIGVIALVCGLYLCEHLEIVFAKGLTEAEYIIARKLMLLLTINLTISFPMSVFSTIISANEKFIFLKVLGMLKTVMGPLVQLPLLLMGFRSIGLVVSTLVFSLVTDAIYIYYVFAILKNRFTFGRTEPRLFRSLFGFTMFIAINMIVDQVNNNIDRVLLGRYKGTGAVTVYSVGAHLYAQYINISTSVSGVFTPRIHHIFNSILQEDGRNHELSKLFIKVGRIQFLILALVSSGMLFFGKAFIRFWIGDGYDESYYVALLLILPATIPLIQNVGIEIQRAANKHQFRSLIYLIMAFCNLIISIYLCQLYGAVGAAIGTAISLIAANGIIMNLYYYKKLSLEIPDFWKNIFHLMIGIIPSFIVGAVIKKYVHYSSALEMLAWMIAYVMIYLICMWLFSMNSFEKELISGTLKKILRKTDHGA